jgi:hypothetical protein
MRCEDVTFEMAGKGFECPCEGLEEGDLVWQPKGGEGHVMSDRFVTVDVGWGIAPWSERACECGRYEYEDHHPFILARKEQH